jgi:glycerophosphoryl diester phosphodiesterase
VPHSEPIAISASPFERLRFHQLAPGIHLPTLTETLDAIGTRATVFIEIKARDIEAHVVRCVRESQSDCAVHSFDHRIVKTVKEIFPAVRCGVLQVARHLDPVASLRATGAEDLWQHVDYIDEQLVADAHSIGGRVIAWTANDSTRWPFLRRIGVGGICTDRIADLATATR